MKQGWAIRPLGDIISFERGLTYAKGDEVEISSIGVLRSNNVDLTTQSLNLDEIKYIRDDFVVPEKKKVKKFSLLMCMSNGSKDHLGKVALIDQDLDFAFGGFMGLLTPNDAEVFPKYLYYALASKSFKDYIHSLADGANINNLKYKDLAAYQILVPSLPEQQRIVDILDQEFAKIDALKVNAEKSLQAAKDLFQSTLSRAFKPNGHCLGDALNLRRGHDLTHGQMKSGVYPVAGSGGIIGLHDKATPVSPCITVGRSGSVGKVYIYEHCWAHNTVLYVDDFKGNNPFYLRYLLLSLDLESKGGGSAVPTLNRNFIHPLDVGFTDDLAEQRVIVNALDELTLKSNTLQDNYQKTLTLCDDLKQALLRKAFNGEL